MIYTVTFNPSIDCVYSVSSFQRGKVNRARKEAYYPGGKGINVSFMLTALSAPTCALGFLAGSTGHAISDMLSQTGCASDFLFLKQGMSRINTKLHTDTETEINGIGPLPTSEDIQHLVRKLQNLQKDDFLVLSGSIPQNLSAEIYFSLIQKLPYKETKTVVDASGELLLSALKARPFLIKPNLEELADIFHIKIQTTQDVLFYAQQLQKWGARNILVSMAEKGSILLDEEKNAYIQPAPIGSCVNSVGAGDAMIGGFLAGYQQTSCLLYALRLGTAAGSATAFSPHIAEKKKVFELFSSLPKVQKVV